LRCYSKNTTEPKDDSLNTGDEVTLNYAAKEEMLKLGVLTLPKRDDKTSQNLDPAFRQRALSSLPVVRMQPAQAVVEQRETVFSSRCCPCVIDG